MNVNAFTSATNLITSAQNKASGAAQAIARLPVQNQEVGGSGEYQSGDLFKPILSLKEAELETSAATKVIKAQDKMLGSLLDIKV